MYKVSGKLNNLKINEDDYKDVLLSQKGVVGTVNEKRQLNENDKKDSGKQVWSEKLQEERIGFLNHLMTGQPMEVTKSQAALAKLKESLPKLKLPTPDRAI